MGCRFLVAIGPQPKNPSKFVSLVWLRPGKGRGPDESDARAFRAELLSLIEVHDAEWTSRDHDPVQGKTVRDFGSRPTLKRHLQAVTLFPRNMFDPGDRDWIGFPLRGAPYSEQDMLSPLQDQIAATLYDPKTDYGATRKDNGLDWFVLLIHYDERAFQYNTPITAPDWDFDLFAQEADFFYFALDLLADEAEELPWDEIFLFDTVNGKARRIYPHAGAASFGRSPGERSRPDAP